MNEKDYFTQFCGEDVNEWFSVGVMWDGEITNNHVRVYHRELTPQEIVDSIEAWDREDEDMNQEEVIDVGTWDDGNYTNCPDCHGSGHWKCTTCLVRRKAELEAQHEADYQRLYKAMQPFIAGGSEYTEWSGIERGIRTIGERMQSADQHAIHEVKRRKEVERQRDDLAAALTAIRDEFEMGCEKWCAANGLTPPAEFQADGMARYVAQEALRRLEGEAVKNESQSDTAGHEEAL